MAKNIQTVLRLLLLDKFHWPSIMIERSGQAGAYKPVALRTMALALMCILGGCAVRPGPEVLNPVSASVPGAKLVTVYVATTRAREIPGSNVFASGRARTTHYAEFKISIPPTHQSGQIEWPTGTPDPAVSFATTQQTILDQRTFEQAVATRNGGRGRLNVGVFVHGFNTNFQEALYRLAQMTADADVEGVPVLFTWPSEAQVTGYVADKDSVTFSRDQLVELLTMLARAPTIGKITVIGHSMGGWLTAEALRQLRLTRNDAVLRRLNVVLAAPDIDVDVFRSQMEVIGQLSPPMMVLVSRDDIALKLSSEVTGGRARLGTLNVDDPRVQEAALKANLQIVDISTLQAPDGFNHDRFVSLVSLYGRLTAGSNGRDSNELRQAGAFVFNSVGTTLSSPFTLVGSALADQ